MRIRNWCFTKFGEAEPPYTKHMRYMIYQREKCPTNGKLHWQGYVEFSEGLTMKAIKKIFMDETLHLEPRKGTQLQAIDYCRKSETAVIGSQKELGESKNQGSRSDLNSIWEAVESGATKLELLHEFRGNAFRHLGMIDRAQAAVHGVDKMDNLILRKRELISQVEGHFKKVIAPTTTEVAGNTNGHKKYKKYLESDSECESDSEGVVGY